MSDPNTWLGLSKSGQQLMITHEKLMKWAYEHDHQFQVGWSNRIKMPDGSRLVRGSHKEEALKAGWADLVKQLSEAGF